MLGVSSHISEPACDGVRSIAADDVSPRLPETPEIFDTLLSRAAVKFVMVECVECCDGIENEGVSSIGVSCSTTMLSDV